MPYEFRHQTPNMAPSSPAPNSSTNWEPSTIVELLALTLTVPGAISAVVTLYMIKSRRRQKKTQMQQEQGTFFSIHPALHLAISLSAKQLDSVVMNIAPPLNSPVHTPTYPSLQDAQNRHSAHIRTTALGDSDSTTGLIHRFNEQLHVLHATTAERQEWEDELALGTRRARVDTEIMHLV
jgi:hypothetical protein